MNSIDVQDWLRRFNEVLARVETGETLTIMRNGVVFAEIRPLTQQPVKLGAFEGEIDVPDSAFAPLTPAEMKVWYGE